MLDRVVVVRCFADSRLRAASCGERSQRGLAMSGTRAAGQNISVCVMGATLTKGEQTLVQVTSSKA
jgi:hypothetical protein